MSFIELKKICKQYNGNPKKSVDDFSMGIEEKEFIAGFEDITSGELFIDGQRMNEIAPRDRGISMVFQNYALYPHMTVEQNISYGLKNMKVPPAEIKQRIDWAIGVLGLEEFRYRKPKNLSGGQRQRVALGRAIVKQQKVFLMDEPLSNLDAKLRVSMRNEISTLHRQLGSTTIYVTHDQAEAMTMADRIVIMKDGIIQQIGKPMELYEHQANKFVAGFIGSPQMNFYDVVLDDTFIKFSSGQVMTLPEEQAHKLARYGSSFTMGIRGEDVKFDPQTIGLFKDNEQKAIVANTEVMGNENNMYFSLGGITTVVRVSKYEVAEIGDEVKFVLLPQKLRLAIGDGMTYRKADYNQIITGEMLPEEFSRNDFRDPKIWHDGENYFILAGNKTISGVPQVLLFMSKNLRIWEFVSVFARRNDDNSGIVWECPDFFCLNNYHVLIVSPQDMFADRTFHNGNNAVMFLGDYDEHKHIFIQKKKLAIDNGFDFYAPQTILNHDGRRIMIAWLPSWDSAIWPKAQEWAGMMSLPREINIIDDKLYQSPVRELKNYYTDDVIYSGEKISHKTFLTGIEGREADITTEIISGDYRDFTIYFAEDRKHHTRITYDRSKNIFELDRTFSGIVRDSVSIRRIPAKRCNKLRIVLDKFSAEIFINDGEQVISTTFYTPIESNGISFSCDGTATLNIEKHKILVP